MGRLEGKRIAVLATDGFEQVELTSPRQALEDEGAQVDVIAPHDGQIRGWKEKDWGDNIDVTTVLEEADANDYDALVLPGGVMNPDKLRANEAAVDFVTAFVEARKPIAAICHGPWTLVETGAVDGRRMTSYHSIKTDLINAGARWTDEAYVIDRGLVTSRSPEDLPVFNEKMIEVFVEGPVTAQPDADEDDQDADADAAAAMDDEGPAPEIAAAEEARGAVTVPAEPEEDEVDEPVAPPTQATARPGAKSAAAKPKRKATASSGARAKASSRKTASHPRGAKQVPQRRAPKRR